MNCSRILRLAPLLALITSLGAQIAIVDSGAIGNQLNLAGTYTQNFDSLPSTTPLGGSAWVNNSTIAGWYSTQSDIIANGTNGALGSYGTSSERALGSTAAYWALRFSNNSSQIITGLSLSYTVEQWYRAANSPQVTNPLRLYYRVYPAAWTEGNELSMLTTGSGWTQVSTAIFLTPNATDITASVLDGNLPENQGGVNVMVSGITLAPGEKLWLRWVTFDDAGNDHALAIDDLSVSFSTAAVPEPASAAILLGLATLAFTCRRRSRS